MFVILWVLAAMGVGYAAKLSGRHTFWWFVIAVLLSPLIGAAALWTINRYGPT